MKYENFKNDFINMFNESEFQEVELLINYALENGNDNIASTGEWSVCLSREKHHALQYTEYIELSKPNGNNGHEINLVFYQGIDNGCDLVDYSMDGSLAV